MTVNDSSPVGKSGLAIGEGASNDSSVTFRPGARNGVVAPRPFTIGGTQ